MERWVWVQRFEFGGYGGGVHHQVAIGELDGWEGVGGAFAGLVGVDAEGFEFGSDLVVGEPFGVVWDVFVVEDEAGFPDLVISRVVVSHFRTSPCVGEDHEHSATSSRTGLWKADRRG